MGQQRWKREAVRARTAAARARLAAVTDRRAGDWIHQESVATVYNDGWARERRRNVRTAISFAVLGVLVVAAIGLVAVVLF